MDSNILEQIRSLIAPLGVEERLAVIQAIAAMGSGIQAGDASSAERRNQLAVEQASWYARSRSERQRYRGEFVAVHDQQVIDHDPDQRSLYLRVRERLGHRPVLIVHADWAEPPVYTFHSPHLERG